MAIATITLTGRLVRKRKRQNRIILVIQIQGENDDEIDTSVSIDRNRSYDYEFLFLDAILRVDCSQQQKEAQQQECLTSENITLIQCAPDPSAVTLVLEGIQIGGEFSLSTLPGVLDYQHACQILALEHRERRLAIAKLVRILEGKNSDKKSRNRLPHTKRCDFELLNDLEGLGRSGSAGWTLMEPVRKDVPVQQQLEADADKDVVHLNIPGEHVMSCRGDTSRAEYIVSKKLPQVRWLIQRVRELPKRPMHIVDVGGGRGDLATGLALAFSGSIITVVDKNLSSLDAGRDHASKLSCGDRVRFCHADFATFVQDPSVFLSSDLPPVDLVVGLHTCGDLSDLALTYAKAVGAAFVVCPCCYAKRYIPNFVPGWNSYCLEAHDALGRLAELNERPTVSRTAMAVINSMRLQGMADYKVSLEEYDSTSSLRNLVLIGVP
jgi:hypothetical protein